MQLFFDMKLIQAVGIVIVLFILIENIMAQPLKIPPPDSEGANWDNYVLANACQPPELESKSGLTMGFACPRLILGSMEMQKAARYDADINNWWQLESQKPYFVYGVIGRDSGPDIEKGCCTCYQLQFDDPSIQPLIVQWVNTGANGCNDPVNGDCDFDLFMGAGGTGNYNACIGNQENSSTFGYFMYTDYPWEGQPWDGGVTIPRNCKFEGSSPYLTRTTTMSCKFSIYKKYKGNPPVTWKRVKCPYGLVRVTGCQRSDDIDQPDPTTINAFTDGCWVNPTYFLPIGIMQRGTSLSGIFRTAFT